MSETELRERVCSEVAKAIRQLREKRGLSMTELATGAGLSRQMISFIEHELRNPTLETLLRITAVLDVELSDLIAGAKRAALQRSKKR